MADLSINVPDVALIFEGGGMRCSGTAGVVVTLIENSINFGRVYGISAGASHSINYISRDIERAKYSFVDFVLDPNFGGWGSFLRGEGYFNAPHLYEGIIYDTYGTDVPMSFDDETFYANPADLHIEAFDLDSGETKFWTKADMPNGYEVGLRVRASSTMPFFMPPTTIDGHTYMDGGLGDSWGIALEAARDDGFKRFFIVRSQKRNYRKKPADPMVKALFSAIFRSHPYMVERNFRRWREYNALLDEIAVLEREGRAYVFYPEHMDLSNRETDINKLRDSYEKGYAQAQRELKSIERFLQG